MKNRIISILVFIFAMAAARVGTDYFREWRASNTVETQMTELRAEAKAGNPNLPEILAIRETSIAKVEELVNSSANANEKLQNAASTFLGFYLINQTARVSYCDALGVGILPFKNAFEVFYGAEYEKAVQVLSFDSAGLSQLYRILEPQFEPLIQQDIAYIAKENGITIGEACQLISDNADFLISEMDFSVSAPAAYSALMSE